jgi:hypothetical protein
MACALLEFIGFMTPLRYCLAAAIALFCSGQAEATLVVFPNTGWTAGAPAAGQTTSQTFSGTPGLTVSINNNGSAAQGATWASGYPALNSTQTTGGFTGENGLQLYATSTSATTAYILTTVTFASPVTNVSFQIWDVDKLAGQFVDTITSIQALSDLGAVQAASSVTSAVSGFNSITGSGLGFVVTGTNGAGNTTNQGTIDVSFTGPITQFSFKWSNTDPGLGGQAIGLGQINYSVVPEMNALFPIATLLVAVGGTAMWRKHKARCSAAVAG